MENQEPQVTEPNEPQTTEPQATEPKDDKATGLTDKHGQPAISKGKYDREIAQRDKRISELEKQVEEAAKTAEGKAELEKQIADVKQELEDQRIEYELELEGCLNTKAAKAVLNDYSDVSELKDKCPYLFAMKPNGATGKKPDAASESAEQRKARARKAAGLD